MNVKMINNDNGFLDFDIPDSIFNINFNEPLIHQLVVSFQSNARSGNRAQKNRADVKHSTKKPWRQKGTGKARAGMTSSPIWRGGGRAFPSFPYENFTKKLNKKMYKLGIKSILSKLYKEDRMLFVDSFIVDLPKTKSAVSKLSILGLNSALIITDNVDENLYLATRNLPKIAAIEPRYIDPLSLISFEKIVITKAAIKQFEEILG
ncbi:50S ribosomal protein L4 [Candidatus Kinetoplastibacterium sorsogonicusi]|uniref:Large ribosomal subunit protein uL4 n=1 Tax=Candidatus Kinetoplastidibacterium kentomonadis TaxID=1576550 RepID=A0A3S7JAV2_9PROT|nr:50S ribosomal protein L4 [Candidatus Kinetoplastibacterium sorsogonicusi]AWD32796.1 50S ribosomal protein L4 [Candidatus Kinetoplastibacterium sorsogonicusi]